jgi:hypothetical protein
LFVRAENGAEVFNHIPQADKLSWAKWQELTIISLHASPLSEVGNKAAGHDLRGEGKL